MIERVLLHVKGEIEREALKPVIFEMSESHYEPGYTHELAQHSFWHLWYVLEGVARVFIEESEFEATPADMFLIPGGTRHTITKPGPTGCRVFDVKFELARTSEAAYPWFSGRIRDKTGFRHLILRIMTELSSRPPAWETAARAMFSEIICQVIRHVSPLPTRSIPQSTLAVQRAIAYIEAHYSQPIKLRDVASHVSFSPKYFASLFKKATGYTVSGYVTEVRIQRAKWLLAESSLLIKEIADETGYKSVQYFSRSFRAMVGVSPTQFRDGHRI